MLEWIGILETFNCVFGNSVDQRFDNLTGEALVITCLQFSKRNARAQGPTSTFTYPLVQQH